MPESWTKRTVVALVIAIVSATGYALDISEAFSISPHWLPLIGFATFAILMFLALRDKQREINFSRDKIRLTARIGAMAFNKPKPGERPLAQNESSIDATVYFEIWSDVDVHTSDLVLNVVRWSKRSWKVSERIFGINPDGQDTSTYRKQIRHADAQPFQDSVRFVWRGERRYRKRGGVSLELAVKCGSPSGIWRALIYDDRYDRGKAIPL